MAKIEETARKLLQQETLDIKKREKSVLCRNPIVKDCDNITLEQGKVQPSFRKDYS